MNIILLEPSDFVPGTDEAILSGRRFEHIKNILQSSEGDSLAVGVLNDRLGEGKVISVSDRDVCLKVVLREDPPCPITCKLILALPRPIVFKRVLESITSMGVKEIYLIQTQRVQKSYWQSPVLEAQNIEQALKRGLEQAKDTILPKVFLKKRFRPFMEDDARDIIRGTTAFFAHPNAATFAFCDDVRKTQGAVTLAVGPEGGFVDYEVDKFYSCGFSGVHLGQRILKVETALHVLIGPWCL